MARLLAGIAGQRGQHLHGVLAVLDGQAQANAVDHPLQAHRVIALSLGDEPLGDHAGVVGQGQHDAAVEVGDAQVDPVFGGECSTDSFEWVVHGLASAVNDCRG